MIITSMKPIYLDYAATTPVDERVAQKMVDCLTAQGNYGNPASLHHYGQLAKVSVEEARDQVADLLSADSSEVIFTSGATESNNLAIKGTANLYQRKGKHIITFKTEHKAVLDPCQYLEKQGFNVTYLTPLPNGKIDIAQLQAAITPETILVSAMHVNNETGLVQDLAAIAHVTSQAGVFLHVDAAQSAGKIPINVRDIPIDLLSMSVHKFYGPKGIGALYLRKKPRIRVAPLIHGGGHEQGMRSGTLPTHQIVGLGAACFYAKQEMQRNYDYITSLRNIFLDEIKSITCLQLNADLAYCIPHIINVRFEGMLSDAILKRLPNIAASTASACQAKSTEGSYVLRALGLTQEQVKSSMRFSFGKMTTVDEIKQAAKAITHLFS